MSSCTKCGYPVGNHPFRHPFAPVLAEAPKPPAAESPYIPLDRAAVAEERERCAKVVETYSNSERATDLILAEIRNPKGKP